MYVTASEWKVVLATLLASSALVIGLCSASGSTFAFARQSDGSVTAANSAHGFSARVDGRGFSILPGDSAARDGWSLRFETRAFGRLGDTLALGEARPAPRGARVELARGAVVEWLENRADGIEHGWTVCAPPGGPEGEPLQLDVAVSTALEMRVLPSGRGATLFDEEGRLVLWYRGLRAWDANRVELDARMARSGHGLSLWIDDRGAAYPLTIDPILTTSPVWIAESNQANAKLGDTVASAGDVSGDGFDDVIVGVHKYSFGQAQEGRALVYHGSASGLSLLPAWSFESDQAGAYLGEAVSSAGDVNGDGYDDVIVSSHRSGGGIQTEGRAWAFYGSATGLPATPSWSVTGGQIGAQLGVSSDGAQQHTQWASTTLTAGASAYVGDTLLTLTGGDTDDDGDVDINDVTLLIAQLGGTALPGGCPWDGTRDADFSNNDAVGSEDYSYFASTWLTTSGCICPDVAMPPRTSLAVRAAVRDAPTSRADLDGDGWVDWRDVDLFERLNGLPGDLSARIREAEKGRR